MSNLTQEQVLEVSADKIRKIKKANEAIVASQNYAYKSRKDGLLNGKILRDELKSYDL